MPAPLRAYDKRTVDADGRMRVTGCRISKATVNGYFGREIPGYEELGLDAGRVYQMYRDAEELRKSAPSFEGVPLLDIHVPVTADSHEHQATVGSVLNPRFEYPYLVADLIVWTQDAKDLIESGEQRELSCAYRYTPDMRPGTSPEGLRYDGRMIMLNGNHTALVAEGRAGPDVLVADEKPPIMKFPKIVAALDKLFANRTATEVVTADSALAEEIDAMDAGLTDEEKTKAMDEFAQKKGCAADALSDEDKTEALRRAAADKRAKDMAKPVPGAQDKAPAVALDEAAITIKAREGYVLATDSAAAVTAAVAAAKAEAVQIATDAVTAPIHALYAARDAVLEKTGLVNLVELNTAEKVYRYALDKLTVPHTDVPAEALAALYTASARAPVTVAADATPFNAREVFAGLRLISRG